MRSDVVWANSLQGGYVYGHAGVRDYWKKQWAEMDSRASPTGFLSKPDGSIEVEVHLAGKDHEGKVLFDTHGHDYRSSRADHC